jgi:hypothetical protein
MRKQNFSAVHQVDHSSKDGASKTAPTRRAITVLCRSSSDRILMLAFILGGLWASFYWALT